VALFELAAPSSTPTTQSSNTTSAVNTWKWYCFIPIGIAFVALIALFRACGVYKTKGYQPLKQQLKSLWVEKATGKILRYRPVAPYSTREKLFPSPVKLEIVVDSNWDGVHYNDDSLWIGG